MTDTTPTAEVPDNSTGQPVGTLEHLDPGLLDIGNNVRDDAALSKSFIASIAENGVLVPITGVRDPENAGVVRIRNGSKAIAVPPVWPDLAGDVLLDVMRELSLEGVVMKRADSTYQPGRRSKSWIKSVLRRRTAVVVGGFIPGTAEPVGSLVVGAHNASGDLVFCGAVRSGLSRKARTALHARLSEIEAPHSPFTDMPSSAGVRWVQPSLIAVIDYREFNGRFRHPAFKGLLHADPTIVPLPPVE